MLINHIEPKDQPDTKRDGGLFELIDEPGKQHGILEYHIRDGILHVDNVVSYSQEEYKGIGTALMNNAINFCLEKGLSFSFEVAKGSEHFYSAWLENTFSRTIDKRLHDTVTKEDRPFEVLMKPGKGFQYSYEILFKYYKKKYKDPHSFIKNNEDMKLISK